MLYVAGKGVAYFWILHLAARHFPRIDGEPAPGDGALVLWAASRLILGILVGVGLLFELSFIPGLEEIHFYVVLSMARVLMWGAMGRFALGQPWDTAAAFGTGATLFNVAIEWVLFGPFWEGGMWDSPIFGWLWC